MADFTVTYDTGRVQHIEATEVEHNPDNGIYTFRNSDKETIGWVSTLDALSVVLTSHLDRSKG
ncbi:hypothetical protein ACWEQC_06745 [Streptomyces shenzhenensis]